jgi:hypothetical protein
MTTDAVEITFQIHVDWDNDGDFSDPTEDISEYFQSGAISLGIHEDLLFTRIAQVGTCNLTLKNEDRLFTPLNTESPYYGQLVPNRAIRVQATDGTTTWPVFRGYIWSFTPESGGADEDGPIDGFSCLIEAKDEMVHIQDVQDMSIPLLQNVLSSTLARHVINAALKATVATLLITMASNPANNNAIEIDSTTLTWKTTLSGGANEILIGANVGASAQNLAAAINQGTGAGTTYSTSITLPREVTATPSFASEYASSNVDTNVYLRGNTGAGGTTTWATTQDGVDHAIVGHNGSFHIWTAQSFQVTAGVLSQFVIKHYANTGSPTGTITWEVRTNNAGVPSSTILASGTYTPVASADNTITVLEGIALQASTTYWLNLRPTNVQSATNYWGIKLHSSSDEYANGKVMGSVDSGASWLDPVGAPFDEDILGTITTEAVATKDKLAQSFVVGTAQSVDTVELYLRKIGSPTGTMTLRIETNDGVTPSGTLAHSSASTTLAESSLTTSFALTTFTFSPAPVLLTGQTYWLVLSTDRSASATDFVSWGADASSPSYSDGNMRSYASSTWSAESKDAAFSLGSDSVTLTSILRGTVGNDHTVESAGSWATLENGTPVIDSGTDTTTITASGSSFGIGNSGGTHYEEAQSFTPAVTGTADQVTITFAANVGSPTGDMTMRICADNSNKPGTVLHTKTFTPVASSTVTVTVTSGPALTASTKYWIWLLPVTPQSSGNLFAWQASTSSSYAGGDAAQTGNGGSTWTVFSANDLQCTIRVAYSNVIGSTSALSGGLDYPLSPAPSLQTGKNTFQYAADNWDENTNAMTALQQVVDSEYGAMLWIARDGTITFKNRLYLFAQAGATSDLTDDNKHITLTGSLTRDEIYNRVEIQYTPLATLASGVIAAAKSTVIAPGLTGLTERWNPTQVIRNQPGTTVVKLPFVDPSTGQSLTALSVVTPLAPTTDYLANENSDGNGVDYTGSQYIKFSIAVIGSNAEITITNTAIGPLHVTRLQVRGVGLNRYNPSFAIAEEELAAGENRRSLAIVLPFASTDGNTFPEALSHYLLSKYKDPVYRVKSIQFRELNLINDVNLFSLEIGDVITVTDYMTGVSAAKYLITGINYPQLSPGSTGDIEFSVHTLGDVSYGEWDSTDPALGDWDTAIWAL